MSLNPARAIEWAEQGYIPDNLIRKGIGQLLKERLKSIHYDDVEAMTAAKHQFVKSMGEAPIALSPEKANEQHYEVPAEFYQLVLGGLRKYSCCYWDAQTHDLNHAEKNALIQTCSHAELLDGQSILELGCGWGSLSLWMAQQYPSSQILAVSNSQSQRQYIESKAEKLNLNNLKVMTCDMNDFETEDSFDRVVSVEMFEHMRNWGMLFKKISNWLKDDGKFFMHVFSHRQAVYPFEVQGESDWMSEYFFSGGMMPSDDLPLYFQKNLKLDVSWSWDGKHYTKTCNAWLKNMDEHKQQIMPIMQTVYGQEQSQKWWMRWRMFFMACAELFAYDDGQQWHVMHYCMSKR